MKLPQQPKIPDSKETIFWLKFQSQIIKKLTSDEHIFPDKKKQKNVTLLLIKLWCWSKKQICIDPDELHGNAYVSKELTKAALVAASVGTIANSINAATTFPFFLLTFKDLGLIAWPLAFLINVYLIKFGNSSASAAADKQPITIGWARIGMAGFISLNLVQSVVAGVGAELLLNQSGLSRKLGEELVSESVLAPLENKISVIEEEKKVAIATRQECKILQQKLERLPGNDSRRDEFHLKAYGSYADRISKGGYKSYQEDPIEQWPLCPKASALEARSDRNLQVPMANYQDKMREVKSYGSAAAYLQAVKPEIYERRFDEVGNVRSGTEATRVAVILFTDKFLSFQWAELGLSLYLFSLSIITSAIAILLAIFYSNREDVQISKSDGVMQAKNIFIRETIYDFNKYQQSQEDGQLLKVFFDELKYTGVCDYSPYVDYIKYARDMEKSQYLREDLGSINAALEQVKDGCQQLKDSVRDSEITAARNLINQGCDSIKDLAGRYFQKDFRVKELIKTLEYVQGYLQYFHLTLPLKPRQIGYIEEVLTSSINLGDRLDMAIHKKYNCIIGNN
ncbi:MAG: hypothetical protein MGG11_05920 [Trichodesmium sp. MAG_R03]|nr:hypothetical protein [Trichodesmium sp. MAG_R03]